jgi:hypothetical protein
MIRDEIMYGILVVALVLFAFWIMPRYEHMTSSSSSSSSSKPALNEHDVEQISGDILRNIKLYNLTVSQSDTQYLTNTLSAIQKGKQLSPAELGEANKRLSSIGNKLDAEIKKASAAPAAPAAGSGKTSSADTQLQSLLKEIDTLSAKNDKAQFISAADMNYLAVTTESLIGTGASQTQVDVIKKTVERYKSLMDKHAGKTYSSSSKSSLSSLNLTLPGPSDEYEPGPMGVDTKDKYVLKSSLVPTCTTCTGGKNMFPTSVVPGDQDGSYATMLPNQYNLMNPDAMLGEEEPKPFLTSFASFMK